MKTINTIFLMGLTLIPFLGSSNVVYVNSSTGNDGSGTGTIGNPLKTFYQAYTNASAGDTINLSGTFDWTDVDEIGDASVTGFTLTKNLVIQGQGAGVTFIQSAPTSGTADRCVFTINHDITLENLTIRNGYNVNQGENSGGITIMDNVRNNIVNISNCSIENNGINNGTTTNYNFAGGIYLRGNTSFHPVINLTYTTFKNNSAIGRAYGAGALYSLQSNTINIESCTFTNNSSSDQSAFGVGYHNVAGGIGFFRFNTVKVTNSTFFSNSSETSGAAILGWYCMMYLTNNTIVSNTVTSVSGQGAGFYMVDLQASPGQVFLKNNLIANNTVNGSGADLAFGGTTNTSYVHDNGSNLVEFYSGGSVTLNGTGTITGDQASLNIDGALADNDANSKVQTLALLSGSVAIGAGSSGTNGVVAVPLVDQRGKGRNNPSSIGAFEFGGTNLPVTMINFSANCSESNGIEINWETASEHNNYFFLIESSIDGQNWDFLDKTYGVGNSTKKNKYQVFDMNRRGADVSYYRIIQTDFDGKETIYGPVSSSCGFGNSQISLYPNPTKGDFVLQIDSDRKQLCKVHIVSSKGLQKHQEEVTLSSGNNLCYFELSDLVPGVYYVNTSIAPEKIIKLVVQ